MHYCYLDCHRAHGRVRSATSSLINSLHCQSKPFKEEGIHVWTLRHPSRNLLQAPHQRRLQYRLHAASGRLHLDLELDVRRAGTVSFLRLPALTGANVHLRIRHVKCDETFPSCLRCTKSGRVCDGYAPKHTASSSIADSLSVQAYAIPFRIPGSASARRLLHYYCVRGAADLGNHVSSGFWGGTVLRYSYSFLPVRQALLALSIVHLEHYSKDPPVAPRLMEGDLQDRLEYATPLQRLQLTTRHHNSGNGSSAEALSQYCKALQCLQRYLKTDPSPQPTVIAVCCIILHLFDCQRREYQAAMAHLEGALQIFGHETLPNYVADASSVTADDSALIAQTLGQIDLRASNYDAHAPLGHLTSAAERSGAVDCISVDSFKTLSEASLAIDRVYNWSLHFFRAEHALNDAGIRELPPHQLAEKQNIARQLDRWSAAFDNLKRHMDSQYASLINRRSTARLLLLHHGVAMLFSSEHVVWGPRRSGTAEGDLVAETLDLAQGLLQQFHDHRDTAKAQARPKLTSGLPTVHGVCPHADGPGQRFSPVSSVFTVVLLIALRTRDDDIRKRAFRILNEVVATREGFLDSCMTVGNLRLWEDHMERRRKWNNVASFSAASLTELERDLWDFNHDRVLQQMPVRPGPT